MILLLRDRIILLVLIAKSNTLKAKMFRFSEFWTVHEDDLAIFRARKIMIMSLY